MTNRSVEITNPLCKFCPQKPMHVKSTDSSFREIYKRLSTIIPTCKKHNSTWSHKTLEDLTGIHYLVLAH